MWVAQGVHDNVGHDLDLVLGRDVRILVIDEEHVHEVTAGAQTIFGSRMSKTLSVVSTATYPCQAKDKQGRQGGLWSGE